MAALRVDSVRLTEDYAAILARMNLPAPWVQADGDPGNVRAANGNPVATVDVERDLPDDLARAVTEALILAVNTCAGFKAVAHG